MARHNIILTQCKNSTSDHPNASFVVTDFVEPPLLPIDASESVQPESYEVIEAAVDVLVHESAFCLMMVASRHMTVGEADHMWKDDVARWIQLPYTQDGVLCIGLDKDNWHDYLNRIDPFYSVLCVIGYNTAYTNLASLSADLPDLATWLMHESISDMGEYIDRSANATVCATWFEMSYNFWLLASRESVASSFLQSVTSKVNFRSGAV